PCDEAHVRYRKLSLPAPAAPGYPTQGNVGRFRVTRSGLEPKKRRKRPTPLAFLSLRGSLMTRKIMTLFILIMPSVAVALAPHDLTRDLRVTGESGGDFFGWSISRAGDVNRDGKMDLLIGAPTNDDRFAFGGRVYLYLGPFKESLSTLDADAVFD